MFSNSYIYLLRSTNMNYLRQSLNAFSGHEAVFKMRCSAGLRIKAYLPKRKFPGEIKDDGLSDSPKLVLSCVMPDTCIAIELDHRIGGIPNTMGENGRRSLDSVAYLQTALSYTNSFGNRRVRVTTLALQVTSSVQKLVGSANFDSLTAFMIRQAIGDIFNKGSEGSLRHARQEIMNKCVSILASYRKHAQVQVSPGQLILPEALNMLPLFSLSLLKSRMFRSSRPAHSSSTCMPSPTADERAFHLFYSCNVSPAMAMLSVHPNLYDLNDMPNDAGELVLLKPTQADDVYGQFEENESARYSYKAYIQLPPLINPSVAYIRPDGVYLLDDGFRFFFFVGRDVSIDARAEFLSFEEGSDRDAEKRHISISTSSDFGSRIWRVISQLRKSYKCNTLNRCERPLYSPVIVVIGNGGAGFRTVIDSSLEEDMIESLVDDENNYEEFLIEIFNRVKNLTM